MAAKAIVGVYGLSLIITKLAMGDLKTSLIYAGAIVLIEVVLRFLELKLTTYTEIENDKVQNAVKILLAEKLMKVEFKYLEDPRYLDSADKAKYAIEDFDALNVTMKSSVDLFTQFITICSLITLIILFNSIILAIIFISALLHFIVSKIATKKQTEMYQKLGPISRRNRYFSSVINDVRYQKDFRIYPLGNLIFEQFDYFLSKNCNSFSNYYKGMGRFQVAYTIINYLQIFSIYIFVAYISITQGLGVGAYILLTASAIKVASSINLFSNRVTEIRRNVTLLQPVFEILDMKDSITLSKLGLDCEHFEKLEFKNITFTYPGTDKIILKDISFDISKGEKISIVGFNGSGKTTIVKLISRFYTPDKGEIYWNGININEYNYESYIEQISAVFQDFKLFAYSISKNVDLEERNKQQIKDCLYQVGLKSEIESLPNNIDSLLSKEFSEKGIDLSGGEKQKIAIARAMYQQTSLAILDEPTSALDPLSEADIYRHFNELVKDKTTIYISHRMSSSKFCDRVLVLDDGIVAAFDTHENLMKEKSDVYYKLFTAQSAYYQ
jgi:ATP-binding cassette subfamily B protein/ATP-binding cassette subfamily C protein